MDEAEGELELFQNLSRIVNRYKQDKVKDLLSELQKIIAADASETRPHWNSLSPKEQAQKKSYLAAASGARNVNQNMSVL